MKYLISFSFAILYCISPFFSFAQFDKYELINKNSTAPTQSLYANLINISSNGVMFGHEDDLTMGVNWKLEDGRSDIMEVCNDFPAVFGWDVTNIGLKDQNPDGISFDMMIKWIQLTYKSGGVNTIRWDIYNLATNKTDESPIISTILPGGKYHDKYKVRLDAFAAFAQQLNIGKSDKKIIPFIFRPFHQNSLENQWWSKENCTPEDYKELWKFTTNYLVKEKGLRNIIFAYSTDAFSSTDEFIEYYPGDDYVDIIGLNLYDQGQEDFSIELSNKLLVLNKLGIEHSKVTAITETGYKQIPANTWWTDQLVKGIFTNRSTANISYLMIGKNVSSEHFYAPYADHSSANNFLQLYQNMYTLFLEDIHDMYVTR